MIPLAIPAALSRVPWKLLGVGLLLLAIAVQSWRLERSERRADKLAFERNELRAVIDDLDRKSRQAQEETARRIERVVKPDDSAARRVETAPLPEGCVTPREVLEADI